MFSSSFFTSWACCARMLSFFQHIIAFCDYPTLLDFSRYFVIITYSEDFPSILCFCFCFCFYANVSFLLTKMQVFLAMHHTHNSLPSLISLVFGLTKGMVQQLGSSFHQVKCNLRMDFIFQISYFLRFTP